MREREKRASWEWNRLVAEATTTTSWIGWVGELGVGEGKRETGELGVEREKRASREKRVS